MDGVYLRRRADLVNVLAVVQAEPAVPARGARPVNVQVDFKVVAVVLVAVAAPVVVAAAVFKVVAVVLVAVAAPVVVAVAAVPVGASGDLRAVRSGVVISMRASSSRACRSRRKTLQSLKAKSLCLVASRFRTTHRS